MKKLTVGEILSAVKVPEPCKYCKEKTDDYRRHKRHCRKWKKAKRRGQVSKEEVNPTYSREIRFRKHKTFRGGCLPVVVDSQLYDLLVLWIRRKHSEESPDTRVFDGIRWELLLTMLTRIVGRDIVAKAEGSGRIGSKAMRQYAATMILEKVSKPYDAMRRIGGSDTMAKKHYQDRRENAYHKLAEKRMLLETSNSSSEEDSEEDSERQETDGQGSDTSPSDNESEGMKRPRVKGKLAPGQRAKSSRAIPCSQPESSSSSNDDPRVKGKLASGEQAKYSRAIHYSEPESSASSDIDDERKRSKAKGKRTPGQQAKSSEHVRYSSSSDDSSLSSGHATIAASKVSPVAIDLEDFSSPAESPPPAKVLKPSPSTVPDTGDAIQPTVTGLAPEAEVPGRDEENEGNGATTPTSDYECM